MEYLPFPARLSADYNETLVHGQAAVAAGENAVDFTAEFIPLLPLGAPACVEWITGETVTAAFAGTVYLSSPGRLRLVGVEEAGAKALRAIFASNTRLPCTLRPRAGHPGAGTHPGGHIVYLSPGAVTLLAEGDCAEGERLFLSAEVDFLTLCDLGLSVSRRLPLRRAETLLLCEVLPTDNANLIALSAYSARLEKRPFEG